MHIERKRQKEIEIITLMIHLYCRYHDDMDADELIHYATIRINKCPRMDEKTFCSQCPIHCFEKKMQEKIKKVMRYSGMRMIFHHPILALRHAIHR